MANEPTRRDFLLTVLATASFPGLDALADGETDYKTTDFSSDPDEVLLARMIFGEARSCSEIERIAVGYTAVNRAKDRKRWNGETLRDSILRPKQYTCFNSSDPNRQKIMNPQEYNKKSFEECLAVARNILSGRVKDPTNGATHYFNPDIVRPSWADKMREIGRIKISENKFSKHVFYQEH